MGKTAIMEQVAREMGIGLVSYSMTHHTRQSALGLPYIATRSFEGETFSVSEYTMSEIIASVYESMEETGRREGILFLDEINCVSETLTPAILQFLQYKVFGRHRVPQGWVVVTAGNPSEYNRSTHDFDVATWDRLKRIDVEPDYEAWRTYARTTRVHPAILAYLDAETSDFYHIETTLDGKAFVTARGWDDLSRVMRVYEMRGIPVTERLIAQYVQDPRTAKRFAVYYDLFNKYRSDYRIDAIVAGTAEASVLERAKAAPFDERVALVGLLTSAIAGRFHALMLQDGAAEHAFDAVKAIADACEEGVLDAADVRVACSKAALDYETRAHEGRRSRLMSADEASRLSGAARFLRSCSDDVCALGPEQVKERFSAYAATLDAAVADAGCALDNVYAFLTRHSARERKRCFSPPTFRPMLRRSHTSSDTDRKATAGIAASSCSTIARRRCRNARCGLFATRMRQRVAARVRFHDNVGVIIEKGRPWPTTYSNFPGRKHPARPIRRKASFRSRRRFCIRILSCGGAFSSLPTIRFSCWAMRCSPPSNGAANTGSTSAKAACFSTTRCSCKTTPRCRA